MAKMLARMAKKLAKAQKNPEKAAEIKKML